MRGFADAKIYDRCRCALASDESVSGGDRNGGSNVQTLRPQTQHTVMGFYIEPCAMARRYLYSNRRRGECMSS